MVAPDNAPAQNLLVGDVSDITIGEPIDCLACAPDKPLLFFYEGKPVRPGYHATEVKAGQFAALDCGANPESWTEMFVQLWDVDEADQTHIPAGKFVAIIDKVAKHAALDRSARLTFEVSDGLRSMQLFRAAPLRVRPSEVHVDMSPRPASCKPRNRWLEAQSRTGGQTSSTQRQACCSA